MNLQDAFKVFLSEYEVKSTRDSYKTDLRLLLDSCGLLDVDEIQTLNLLAWRMELHERELAQTTIDNRMKKAKRFFNWCVDCDYLERSPAERLRIKQRRQSNQDKAAPKWVLEKMMVFCIRAGNKFKGARDCALFGMMIEYGARRGDVVSARISRMTSTHFTLTVKGGHESAKLLTPAYRQLLMPYLEMRGALENAPVHDYIFVGTRRPHNPLKAKSVNALIDDFSEMAGMRITPHAIRHWFGQSCADLRLPPTVTQALMDHADVKTTMRYYYNQDRVRIDDALQAKSILGNPRSLINFPTNFTEISSGHSA